MVLKLRWAEETVQNMTEDEQSLRAVIVICGKEGPLVPEPIINAICSIFRFTNTSHRLLRYILWVECAVRPSEPSTLLRDNTLINKLIVRIGANATSSILDALRPHISSLMESKTVHLEASSARLRQDNITDEDAISQSKKNVLSLKEWADTFLKAVLEAPVSQELGEWMRMVFHAIVKAGVPTASRLSFISSFMFCRIICPHFIATAKIAAPRARRNLILLSKVLQKVANGIEFDPNKDKAFILINDWAKKAIASLQRYVHRIVVPPPPPPRNRSSIYQPASIVRDSMASCDEEYKINDPTSRPSAPGQIGSPRMSTSSFSHSPFQRKSYSGAQLTDKLRIPSQDEIPKRDSRESQSSRQAPVSRSPSPKSPPCRKPPIVSVVSHSTTSKRPHSPPIFDILRSRAMSLPAFESTSPIHKEIRNESLKVLPSSPVAFTPGVSPHGSFKKSSRPDKDAKSSTKKRPSKKSIGRRKPPPLSKDKLEKLRRKRERRQRSNSEPNLLNKMEFVNFWSSTVISPMPPSSVLTESPPPPPPPPPPPCTPVSSSGPKNNLKFSPDGSAQSQSEGKGFRKATRKSRRYVSPTRRKNTTRMGSESATCAGSSSFPQKLKIEGAETKDRATELQRSPSPPLSTAFNSQSQSTPLHLLKEVKDNEHGRHSEKTNQSSSNNLQSSKQKAALKKWQGWEENIPAPIRAQASALSQYLRFVAEVRHPEIIRDKGKSIDLSKEWRKLYRKDSKRVNKNGTIADFRSKSDRNADATPRPKSTISTRRRGKTTPAGSREFLKVPKEIPNDQIVTTTRHSRTVSIVQQRCFGLLRC